MNHMLSVNKHYGNKVPELTRMPLDEALDYVLKNAPASKSDCWLLTGGYSSREEVYHRGEESFDSMDTILLDFDNEDENGNVFDPDLLTKFEEEFADYEHIVWESASSVKGFPKFRAIFLLDRTIPYLQDEGVKYTKKAVLAIFAKYRPDTGASWYYSPVQSKVETFKHTRGRLFPSQRVEWMAESIRKATLTRLSRSRVEWERRVEANDGKEIECDPYKLPCVKRYLEGSWSAGTDRRPRAHAAIFGMLKFGVPSDKIREVIMSGPASEFTQFLHDSFRDSCRFHHLNLINPF